MKNINSKRVFRKNEKEANTQGKYVLYWMQINRRMEHNYALEYAVAWANKLDLPLLVYEGLRVDYPWASDRIHQFILQGMKEHLQYAHTHDINYLAYAEKTKGEGRGLVKRLCEQAAVLISDEFPVFIIPEHNRAVASKVEIPFFTVDANGVLPMAVSEKDPYSAFIFRKTVQKYFREAFESAPKAEPLRDLKMRKKVDLGPIITHYGINEDWRNDISSFVSSLDIDHQVEPLPVAGTREEALRRLDVFLDRKLNRYEDERNHPDTNASSGLSPWLHFGKISSHEIVSKALAQQPKTWSFNDISSSGGKNRGYFKGYGYIESFLDELITWREVGYHFAFHRPDYAEYTSLPKWALATLEEHKSDPRPKIYSLEELELSKTDDALWNAAQNQLRRDGIIHNYLRMLWGKKVLEWTPDAETALAYLIELNNKYAIDGRNPNSYSGIFWIFGRFDRAWGPERPIYGKVRYMTSESTRRKLKLDRYLAEFGSENQNKLKLT